MKIDKLVKKYNLLIDEEGLYYKVDEAGNRLEPYFSIYTLSEILKINWITIKKRVVSCKTRLIRNYRLQPIPGYNLNDILKCCPDLFSTIPSAEKDGFARTSREAFAATNVLAKHFGVSEPTIKSRVTVLTPIQMIHKNNLVGWGYNREEVRILIADLIEELPCLDENDLVYIGEDLYASLAGLAKYFKTAKSHFFKKAKNLTALRGRKKNGHIVRIYKVDDFKAILPASLKNLPQTDKNGFVVIDGRTFATITALAKSFKLSKPTIKTHTLNLASKNVLTHNKKLAAAYDYLEVETACSCLLQNLPIAASDGYALIDGEPFAPVYILARDLGLSSPTIKTKAANLKSKKIKSRTGGVVNAYSREKMSRECSELLQDVPIADESGFATVSEEKYGPISVIAKDLGLNECSIKNMAKNFRQIVIKDRCGNIRTAINRNDVERAFSALLAYPKVNDRGTAIINGQEYAGIGTISLRLKIHTKSIRKKLSDKKAKVLGKNGQIIEAYPLKAAEEMFPNALLDLPQADETGFAIINGEKYAPIKILAQNIALSPPAIKARLGNAQFFLMRTIFDKIVKGYNETHIKAACADLLTKKKLPAKT